MKKKRPLALWVFAGLAAGIAVGVLLTAQPDIANNYIKPFGTLYLNLLKFIVVPIVLFSIMEGVISMQDIKKVGSIGGKTIVFYLTTTGLAVTLGLIVTNIFKGGFPRLSTSALEYEAAPAPGFMQTLLDIFPSNVIKPLLDSSMLQIIFIALLFGFATIASGKKGEAFGQFITSGNDVSLMAMSFIIKTTPIGVFCLIVPVVAVNGPQILGSLAYVLLISYLCYILHAVLVYSISVRALAGMSPAVFFKGVLPTMLVAFSSASSLGALPINLDCVKKLGVKKEIASFVLPLGATINMDGTAIYQGVCAIFIASCYGVQLTLSQQLIIVLTAVLASIGTAAVPGSGMIMLAMVLQSVGLPVEGIALIAGVDRISDMGRTTVNAIGDAACAVVVNHLEEKREQRQTKL